MYTEAHFVSVIFLSWWRSGGVTVWCGFNRVLVEIFEKQYDTSVKTAEGSEGLVDHSVMMEECASWDMSSARIIHLHHCHVFEMPQNKN